MVTWRALVSEPRPLRRNVMAARAAVVLLAAILYAGTLGHGFVYDDEIVAQTQKIVRTHRYLEAFTTPYHQGADQRVATGLYRPLTILTFAIQHELHDGRPLAFHAANIVLHAIASLLVLELAMALAVPFAAATGAALLFTAHPVHVEAVAGIAGRAEVLSAVFYLSALLAYVRSRVLSGRLATAGLLFLSLLSKETAVTFPAAALAWELLIRRDAKTSIGAFLKGHRRELVAGGAAVVVPIAIYLIIRRAVLGALLVPLGSLTVVENPLAGLGLAARLATAAALCWRYVVLLVAPLRLSPDWGFAQFTPVASPLDPGFLLGVAALCAGAVLFAVTCRRNRAAAYALVLGAASYSIVSNTAVLIGIGMAERLLYLPSVAFCILVALAFPLAARRIGNRLAVIVAAVLLLAAGARTVAAAATWRNDFTLFSAAETAAPRSIKVLGNLAVEFTARGQLDEARARLLRAVALAPDHVVTRINLAGVLLKLSDLDGALAQVREALRLAPKHPVALAQLGAILRKRGALHDAEAALRLAVEADPSFLSARLDLAGLLIGREAWDEAEQQLKSVLALDAASEPAKRGLAIIAERRTSGSQL